MRFKEQYVQEAGVSLEVYPDLQEFISNGSQDGGNRWYLWKSFKAEEFKCIFMSIFLFRHNLVAF